MLPVLLPNRVSQAQRRRQARHRRPNRNPDRIALPAWPADTDGTLPRRYPGTPNRRLPEPTQVHIEESLTQTPVLLHAARHEQPRRPVIAELHRSYAHADVRTWRTRIIMH